MITPYLIELNSPAINLDDILDKKGVLRGRTEEIAAKLVGLNNYKTYFDNYKTYQQAKKIVKNGVTELPEAVDKGLSVFRAFQISKHPPKKQLYLLSLDSSSMAKALCEAESQKGADKWKKISRSNFHSEKNLSEKDDFCHKATATWALLSFNVTLFRDKRTQKLIDQQNKINEKEITLQKTTIPD